MTDIDVFFMSEALKEAMLAFEEGETPIGAVITLNGEIIAKGHNKRNTQKNPLAHAEIIAINDAAAYIGDWRLEETTIYVTIEPCPMCAGAIIQSRIKRLVYGAGNKKAGCGGSIINLFDVQGFNHKVEVITGILESETSAIMSKFFKDIRTVSRDG